MLHTVLELSLSMGIIHLVIWCFRAYVCYSSLCRLNRIETHIYTCLSYSNLLFFLALKKDNYEASKALARRDNQRKGESLRSLPLLSQALSPLRASSLFDKEQLEYKRHSGEIRPYFQFMQSWHEEARHYKEELLDYCEESGMNVDCEFLDWDCATPFPESQRVIYEEYNEVMTAYTFSVLQAHYFDLFDAIQEIVKYKHRKLQQLFTLLILIPAFNSWFQLRFAPPSRERIYKGSSKLKAEYQHLRRKTGADRYDHLFPISA